LLSGAICGKSDRILWDLLLLRIIMVVKLDTAVYVNKGIYQKILSCTVDKKLSNLTGDMSRH